MKTKALITTSLVTIIFGFLAGSIIGIIIGVKIAKPDATPPKTEVITSRIVLERIKDQAFLITRTLISDQQTVIEIDQGSAWSNFWWGHEITAQGSMQVDLGVDLSKLTESDIEINDEDKVIYIKLPKSEVFDASLKGDIKVETSSGILKSLLASDSNQDYNLALEKLTEQARDAALNDKEMLDEAEESALSTIEILINETGYIVKEKPAETN